jgi:hypothetical protein
MLFYFGINFDNFALQTDLRHFYAVLTGAKVIKITNIGGNHEKQNDLTAAGFAGA